MKKHMPKNPPLRELTYVPDDAPPKLFVIRHKPSSTWWGPNEAGYFAELARAGTYSEEAARLIEGRRGEDEAVPLDRAVREYADERFKGGNPIVLQALFALGAR